MNNFYICRVSAFQARGNQIDIPKTVATSFFGVPLEIIEEQKNFEITLCHANDLTDFVTMEIQTATNIRWSVRLNSYLADNDDNIEEDDFLLFEKIGRAFSVQCLKGEDELYEPFYNLLDEGEKHMLLTSSVSAKPSSLPNQPLQQIFYGAPGTGKSHTIKKTTDGLDSKFVVRTTFHPDSDYSTFVGAYKPKMEVMPRYNPQTGEQMGVEKRIVYAYTPQAFLKAYVRAWQNPEQAVYLIIEEINRGNCAQIFGDLFQLLDRKDDGQSCYPIKADQDMMMHLMEEFASYDVVPKNVRSGEELVLPPNLYIWATMNTSDQSLFPIDSAFKRRWEWKYIPITQGKDKETGKLMQWSIEAEGVRYDWWSFLEVMNKRVGDTTSSEDKKLGFFFCKADGQGIISADKFVGKVLFYLWNDVFKDYPDNPIATYLKEEDAEFTYGNFYTTDNSGEVVVREELVTKLLEALEVEKVGETFFDEESEDGASNNNFAKYSFNGSKPMGKSELGYRIMDKYLSEHTDATFEQIKQAFPDSLTAGVPNKGLIVELTTDLASYVRYYADKQYSSADGVKFRIFKQWTIRNVNNIIAFAKEQGWSIEEAGNWDRANK